MHDAEDREAEALLAGMIAAEPENYIRGLLPGAIAQHSTVGAYGDTEKYVRQLLSGLTSEPPPDGPYDAEDLEIVTDEDLRANLRAHNGRAES